MSRMTRRTRPIGAVMIALMLVLAACGAPGQPAVQSPSPAAAQAESPAAQPAESPTAAQMESQATPESQEADAAATQAADEGQPASQSPAAASPAGAVKNPDTFVSLGPADVETLDPAFAYDTASGMVIFNVYESLLFPMGEQTNEFVPMLASDWNVSDDGTTYTFTIREGVTFHEGQELTPEDVAYSLWRGMIQDRSGGPQWMFLQPFFGLDVHTFKDDIVDGAHGGDWVAACEAVKEKVTFDADAGTVTMNLAQAFGPMPQLLSTFFGSVLSKPWVEEQGGWTGDCATAEQHHDPAVEEDELFDVMNGTGPYKLERWSPGEEIVLVRNDNYWRDQPLWDGSPSGPARVERVSLRIVEEWGTRFATLQAGDADFVYIPRQYVTQVDPLVRESCDADGVCETINPTGSLRLYKGLPTTSADTIYFNQQVNTTGGNPMIGSGQLDGEGVPPDFFADIHVRRAFNYCFDWDTYIADVFNGEAQQVPGPIISGLPGHDPQQERFSFDLDRCAEEFQAAEITAADGASLWDTGFRLQLVYPTASEEWRTAGEILKDGLSRVNPAFQLDLTEQPWPAFLGDLTESRMPIYALGWQEDFHDPHNWVTAYLASGGANAGFQHFPEDLQAELDQLVNAGISETDEAERERIYRQLQNMAYEHALNIFLVQAEGRHYEQAWVQDWYYNPTYPIPGLYFYALGKGQ